MKKHFKAIILAIIIIFLAVGSIFLYLKSKSSQKNVAQEKVIETFQVKKSDPLTFNGISKSRKIQTVSFNQSLGETIRLEKQNGDAVTQGDIIATYYSLKDDNAILDKQSKIRQKNTEIENFKKDVQGNSSKITGLTNEVNQLNKEINKLKDNSPNKIYAQFDGICTIPTSSGNDGVKPLAEISSNDMSVEIQVSEYDLGHLKKDQEVRLSSVDSDKKIDGTISVIAQRPDNTTSKISTYTVEVNPTEELKNGNHVQVSIPLNEIKIPKSAVKEEDKKLYVYKANGSKYTKKEIQGAKKDNYFVVTSGLQNNGSIVKNYKDAN